VAGGGVSDPEHPGGVASPERGRPAASAAQVIVVRNPDNIDARLPFPDRDLWCALERLVVLGRAPRGGLTGAPERACQARHSEISAASEIRRRRRGRV
jgi:hypothetical protein